MSNQRIKLCFLVMTLHLAAQAQIPPDRDPRPSPQGYLAPGEPGATGGAAQQLPHQGKLPNAPTSSASRRFTQRPTVTIREFRSSVPEVALRGATDMFIAALVKTRQFRVLERSRMAEGVGAEKMLSQQGMTTGQAGQSQYESATYVFEAVISEASVGDKQRSFAFGLAGATAGRGSSADTVAIDVRMVDVESGIVVDAVSVRKEIKASETRVAGVSSALAHLATRGRGNAVTDALAPADQYLSARKDSVDKAIRDAIDEAVREIAARLESE